MTIAYKFMEHAEQQNMGYRVPTRRLCDFLGYFNENWRTQYGQHSNSLEAEAFRATLFTAALSYGFGMDLRDEFGELNFPIDDPIYAQLMEEVIALPCSGTGKVRGDLNKDCKVDLLDLFILSNQWLDDWSQ